MKKHINTPILYSLVNGAAVTVLLIASKYAGNDMFYIAVTIFCLAIVNIFLLISQLIERDKRYEEARLKAQRLSYLNNEILHFRQLRHDIKNHLIVIRELANMKKIDDIVNYTDKLTDNANQALIECHTGVDEVDILLYTKKGEADTRGIDFKINVQAAMDVAKKHTLDIVSILSNLLDNALEATGRIDVAVERFVQVRLYDDVLSNYIVITNSFSPKYNIKPEQAFIKRFTTKANRYNHGLGLSIVRKLVRRHGGQINVDIFNGIFFQIKIELPKHKLN